MASELKVNKITPESGVTLTLGDSGDTINFGSGVLPNFENLTVTGDLTVDTNSLKVDSTNNFVGIGTASPTVALDVVGAITATGNITGTLATAAQPNITSLGTLTGLTVDGNFLLGLTTGAASRLTIDGDISHRDNASGDFAINNFENAAITFGTYTGNTGGERMRITSSGNVGIGTSSPNERLSVVAEDDSSAIDNGFAIYRSVGDDKVNINAQGGAAKFIADGGSSYIPYRFFGYDGTTLAERLTIDGSGNVGIGTSSPASKLHIDGSGLALRLDGTANTSRGIILRNTGTAEGQIQTDGNMHFIQEDAGRVMKFSTANTERMRIDSSGNVGIGDSDPNARLHVQTSGGSTSDPNVVAIFQADTDSAITTGGGSAIKFRGKSSGGNIPDYDQAMISSRGQATNNAHGLAFYCKPQAGTDLTETMFLNSGGDLSVIGSISKGSGSFRIDHPLPEKTNTHNLIHSFVEAPTADNIYRGKVDLVNGTATVNIDTVAGMSEGTFILLNREIQCFTSNETGWTAVKGSVSGNILTITAQDETCTDTISWLVIGERQDQHMYDTEWTDENGKVIVEPLKPVEEETIE